MTIYRTGLVIVSLISLAACGQWDATRRHGPGAGNTTTFAPADYRIELHYDDSLQQIKTPRSGYFANGGWQLDGNSPGDRLLTLSLPGSDEITRALWRLGASRDPMAVKHCLTPPDHARAMSHDTTIGGQPFHGFTLEDAGMNHFQHVEGYRAIVDGACYAIDLIVQGTNGEVYDPPREAPFSPDEAMRRLRTINDAVSFSAMD
ncbi:hypothetical protein GCM10027040_01220 [Halomonas shantousis]